MTVSKDDLVGAIAKLNDLTRRKEIFWTSPDQATSGRLVDRSSYLAIYEGRKLRVSELRRSPEDRRYDPEVSARRILEILDDSGNPVYEFPDVQGISDLFASVRAQQADVDVEGLIRSLLTSG
jgi:hypothetical protein